MILAKKVRIYPTKEQEQKLWQSVGTARFIYNYTLAKQEENYKNGGKFISDGIIRKELTQLKKSELIWLNEVSNNVTKQAGKDACNAYKRFFKGLAKKPKFKSRKKSKPSFYNDPIKLKVKEKKVLIEKVGWIKINEQLPSNVAGKDACNAYKRFFKGLAKKPKFKSRKKSKPSFYNDPIKLKVKEKKVLIEKVGWIKINEQLPSNVKYNNPRITYDNKYWYISVGIEVDKKQEELTDISLGIDLGLKDLAICSDEKVFKNINKKSF